MIGSPEEPETARQIGAVLQAAQVKKRLTESKLAAIGQTPQGFGFGRALDTELLRTFGVTLEAIEARELIEKAKGYSDEEADAALAKLDQQLVGLDRTPEKNRRDFARLYLAYTAYVKENQVDALASRCWPDFFTSFGTPVCAVLAILNAMDIPASCETDIYGVLSMYIGSLLTGRPAFFGDPVSLDEGENTLTFWHCGMAPTSLAREDTGPVVGVHPNRKIGPVMDFGCAAADQVTIFRVGRQPDGTFRFLVAEGEALDRPKQFEGVSVVVRTKSNARQLVERCVKAGWEPHYAVLYGDASAQLKVLGEMLGIEIWPV